MMALHLLFSFEHEIINMYIIYLVHVTNSRKPRTPMSHLQFKANLCEALLAGWEIRNFIPKDPIGLLYAFSLRCSKTLHGLRG
jgi:hypothetical protein